MHTHLKDEMINSSFFASAWFITIFTNAIKHPPPVDSDSNKANGMNEMEILVSDNLLELWDYFLVGGWKAILKMGLFVLIDSSHILLRLSFEEILNEITEKPRTMLSL